MLPTMLKERSMLTLHLLAMLASSVEQWDIMPTLTPIDRKLRMEG